MQGWAPSRAATIWPSPIAGTSRQQLGPEARLQQTGVGGQGREQHLATSARRQIRQSATAAVLGGLSHTREYDMHLRMLFITLLMLSSLCK